jgi:hypothetical protein
MFRKISSDQINAVLQEVFLTNVSAAKFEAIKNLFAGLPVINEEKPASSLDEMVGEKKEEVE